MDMKSPGSDDTYPRGIPKDPDKWEAYLFDQRAMYAGNTRAAVSRRKTVAGIPTFADFKHGHHERTKERYHRSRKDSHLSPKHDIEHLSHDTMHFGSDSPPRSASSIASSNATKRSSPRMPMSKRQHALGSRHTRHGSFSRPQLPEAFASAPEVPLPDSPDSFKRKIHEHKANFYASQKHRNYSRPRHKSLLSSGIFDQPAYAPPPQPATAPAPSGATPITAYALWRQECDEQLNDKSAMTHVPPPSISTCSECASVSVQGGQPVPIACSHSLAKILRTGVSERPNTFAYSKAYFDILKQERQRWHTDRFGACNIKVKASIEADAKQLFVLINALFEAEKLRMVELAEFVPERMPAHAPDHTPDFFKFRPDEHSAW